MVEKHIIGQPNFRGPVQKLVKRPLFWLMGRILSGDLDGETRIYVLAPRAAAARAHGPGEVY